MIIDNIDPKTVRGSVGLMLREERLACRQKNFGRKERQRGIPLCTPLSASHGRQLLFFQNRLPPVSSPTAGGKACFAPLWSAWRARQSATLGLLAGPVPLRAIPNADRYQQMLRPLEV